MRAYLHTETDATDTTCFVSHQLDVLLEAVDEVHGYIARKQREQADAAALLKPGSKLARRTHDTSCQTARAELFWLVEAGLMNQHRHGKGFVFIARLDLDKKLHR